MHIFGFCLDLYSFLQFFFTAFFISLGLLYLVKNTASKYFFVDANFNQGTKSGEGSIITDKDGRKICGNMISIDEINDSCASCGNSASKKCSGCKVVRYCSESCQSKHWRGGHKLQCNEFKRRNLDCTRTFGQRGKSFRCEGSTSSTVVQPLKKVLFAYEEFVTLFNWDKPGFPPCGLLNCGNSCFANVVLQCLSCTRPLVAYLLERGHHGECKHNGWCFLCELQIHVERAIRSSQPFSPINILSRIPNIGGNLGYGKQEDAHEFMRFAVDTMQSACLDEFGGEKSLHPRSLETTIIQHIFGGQLESQVTCTKCNKTSSRYENMMDLTVEIQGDAESLEDCLDQFTVKEWLDGDNMYKCEGCNDYVKAWKRLTIYQAPNVLTIALKRFQSGRFGKLNKRVTFPQTLDLGPYMSEASDGTDLYQLYAVVVHVDMLNASYFGHYICYTKDFDGNWYRVDDCQVMSIDLEEVLDQGAYMLLYSRTSVRPQCAKLSKPSIPEDEQMVEEVHESLNKPVGPSAVAKFIHLAETRVSEDYDVSQHAEPSILEKDSMDIGIDDDPLNIIVGPAKAIQNEVEMCNGEPHDYGSDGSIEVEVQTVSSSNGPTSIELELEPNSDAECSSMIESREKNNFKIDFTSTKSSVGQNGNNVHEMADISSGIPVRQSNSTSTTKTLEEDNSASCERSSTTRLENLGGSEVTPAGGDSSSESKPMFSPGFLDKNTRYRSINGNRKAEQIN